MMDFPLTDRDYSAAYAILGPRMWRPDLIIAPDGEPYLYRWHIIPRSRTANVYFHIQVADDPREELHDHPWDNTSIILAGGYMETISFGHTPGRATFTRKQGDVIFRRAAWGHRLQMGGHPYTMTLFTTGPHIRDWGYWFPDGWHHNLRHNVMLDGKAVFMDEEV